MPDRKNRNPDSKELHLECRRIDTLLEAVLKIPLHKCSGVNLLTTMALSNFLHFLPLSFFAPSTPAYTPYYRVN